MQENTARERERETAAGYLYGKGQRRVKAWLSVRHIKLVCQRNQVEGNFCGEGAGL